MRIGCVLIICFGALACDAQDRSAAAAYLNRLAKNDNGYFYALYAPGNFIKLTDEDSALLKRFLSKPNLSADQHSLFVSRISDLDRLRHLQGSVVVYGPRSMESYVMNYTPTPDIRQTPARRYNFLRWFGNSYLNFARYTPACNASSRWILPYTFNTVEANPNSLPFYLTRTNTNKYLLPDATRP